jgi:hypothetical protein
LQPIDVSSPDWHRLLALQHATKASQLLGQHPADAMIATGDF